MRTFAELRRAYRRNAAALAGTVILVAVVLMAVSANVIFSYGPLEMVTRPLLEPGMDAQFPLGSDKLGRDVLAGIFYGARISLLIGIVATLVAVVAGTTIGALAGYYGGWIDDALMRVTEIFQIMPPFLFLIVLVGIFQPSVLTIVLAIGAVSWPWVARLVRAEFLSLREREFVQASIGIGMGDARIIFTQILPNALPPVIVSSSMIVARSILNESALAFLGLGDPNLMSWGAMIGSGRDVLRQAAYLSAVPGIAILLTVLALNVVGDGLNDALNPRHKER